MSANSQTVLQPTRITADEIIERINRGEKLSFLDVRNPSAWAEADTKLRGAIRVPADQVAQHLKEIPRGRTIITYCT